MSGGHFDHEESYLDYLADQLEQDIKYNEVPWDKSLFIRTQALINCGIRKIRTIQDQ